MRRNLAHPVIFFCSDYNNGKSGYLMTTGISDDFEFYCDKKIYKIYKNTRRSLSTIHLFKDHKIEISEEGLLVLNMLLYPVKIKYSDFQQAKKTLDHLKRNNVKINRYLD